MILPKNYGKLGVFNPPPGNHRNVFLHLKYSPMVTTDIAQLTGECTTWKDTLREQKSLLASLQQKLQQISSSLLNKERLQHLEHLQNQLYIQSINVHDLKHAVKEHGQVAAWEQEKNGQASEATWAMHEDLHAQFEQLQQMIQQVQLEFDQFVSGS